jgi:hypothetical protein
MLSMGRWTDCLVKWRDWPQMWGRCNGLYKLNKDLSGVAGAARQEARSSQPPQMRQRISQDLSLVQIPRRTRCVDLLHCGRAYMNSHVYNSTDAARPRHRPGRVVEGEHGREAVGR